MAPKLKILGLLKVTAILRTNQHDYENSQASQDEPVFGLTLRDELKGCSLKGLAIELANKI